MRVTSQEVVKMRRLKDAGHTCRAIATYFCCSAQTVSRRLRGPSRARKEPFKKRKAALRLRVQKLLSRRLNGAQRYCSTRKLAGALGVSRMTTYRALRDLGLRVWRRPARPFASADNEKRRRFIARVRKWPLKTFRKLVFSDEHWITTNDHTCPTMWAKAKNQVIPRVQKSRFNVPSFMIWAAIGVGWKSELVFIKTASDKKAKQLRDEGKKVGMDSNGYIRKCLSGIVPSLKGRIFMQDGARPHVGAIPYLERKNVEFIEDWPPYSPDLNPIENVWPVFDRRIAEYAPRTIDDLKKAAQRVWAEFPQAEIDNFVLSFRSKIAQN